MKMNSKTKIQFDTVERVYLDEVSPKITNYEVKVSLAQILDDEVASDESEVAENSPKSFSLDIDLISEHYQKKIEFSFSDGHSIDDNGYYHALRFSIRNVDKQAMNSKSNQWFSLQDYFKHNNIDGEIDDFFGVSDYDDALVKISKFIGQITFLLEGDDIKHILSSKDWIKVPHDKSMYF